MNLKAIRLNLGITQKQMAKFLELNYNTYISYEYGNREPSKFVYAHIERCLEGHLAYDIGKADPAGGTRDAGTEELGVNIGVAPTKKETKMVRFSPQKIKEETNANIHNKS